MILSADIESGNDPIAILVCTHAAPLIAIARVLTGLIPADVEKDDFKTYTACITRFERQSLQSVQGQNALAKALGEDDEVPPLDVVHGKKGVAGGWTCVLNGDCRHLQGGEERGWNFAGDESFSDISKDSKL